MPQIHTRDTAFNDGCLEHFGQPSFHVISPEKTENGRLSRICVLFTFSKRESIYFLTIRVKIEGVSGKGGSCRQYRIHGDDKQY